MLTTRVFQSGNSQAMRIPKEVRTDKEEFYIQRVGEGYVVFPTDDPWFPLRITIGTFPQDFMEDREQPSLSDQAEREEF
jgi:antitoxin VapB